MVKEFIFGWFSEKAALAADELEKNADANYFEKGFIDSFAFLELINSCEEKMGITFSDDDFSDDNIFTINGLIAIVEKRASDR